MITKIFINVLSKKDLYRCCNVDRLQPMFIFIWIQNVLRLRWHLLNIYNYLQPYTLFSFSLKKKVEYFFTFPLPSYLPKSYHPLSSKNNSCVEKNNFDTSFCLCKDEETNSNFSTLHYLLRRWRIKLSLYLFFFLLLLPSAE